MFLRIYARSLEPSRAKIQKIAKFRERLRSILANRKLTPEGLAKLHEELKTRSIYSWLKETEPTLGNVFLLAEVLDCSVGFLIGEEVKAAETLSEEAGHYHVGQPEPWRLLKDATLKQAMADLSHKAAQNDDAALAHLGNVVAEIRERSSYRPRGTMYLRDLQPMKDAPVASEADIEEAPENDPSKKPEKR